MSNLTTALAVGCIMLGAFLLIAGSVGVYDAVKAREWRRR